MVDPYFKFRFKYDPRREIVWSEIARYLKPWISPESQVLDLGAGYCHFINAIKASRRYALDASDIVRNYSQKGVEPIISKANYLPMFRDGSLDVILVSNLFEHLDHEEFQQTLAEIKRVLKLGGRLIVLQPNFRYSYREYFDDYTHKQIFTDQSLSDLLQVNGFSIELIKARFIPFSLRTIRSFWIPRWFVRFYLKFPWKIGAKQMLIISRLESA